MKYLPTPGDFIEVDLFPGILKVIGQDITFPDTLIVLSNSGHHYQIPIEYLYSNPKSWKFDFETTVIDRGP